MGINIPCKLDVPFQEKCCIQQHLVGITGGILSAGRCLLRWDAHSGCVSALCCRWLVSEGCRCVPCLGLKAVQSKRLQSALEGSGLLRVDAHTRQRPADCTHQRQVLVYHCLMAYIDTLAKGIQPQ